MGRRFKWLWPLLISYLVFLVVLMPVRPLYALLAPHLDGLQVSAPRGRIWKGEAERIRQGNLELGRLQWSLAPATLLRGALGFHFVNQDQLTRTTGVAAITLGGDILLLDVQGHAPAANLYALLGMFPLGIAGTAEYRFEELRLDSGSPVVARGELDWRNARLLSPLQATLGNLHFRIQGEDGKLEVQVSDKGGPLGVSGSIHIEAGKGYDTDLLIRPRKQAAPALVNTLRNLGKPRADGAIALRYSGVL